jgi:pyridinium-3,5-bisthiocarboxylic acid mononucleotide nickel chelatase
LSRLLYIDCVGGVAGDMLLAALLDAGADEEYVREGLSTLALDGLGIELTQTYRHGIRAAHVEIVAPTDPGHHSWSDLRALIDKARLRESVRRRSQDVFRRLAVAEGRIHGIAPEQVHFHEVGALDAVADVCGVVLALEALEVDRIVCSPLPASRGFVEAAHGRLPLPAPATLELLRGAPIYGLDLDVELVTPTGAALVTTLADDFGPLPPVRLETTGYGAGSRDIGSIPNLVRALVGEAIEATATAEAATATVSLIEANLDDLPPELVPDAAESCFAAGALDVWATPAQMKKGRPGIVLSALARAVDERRVAEAILRETSTLGVRIAQLRRWELERDVRMVEVDGEPVRVKVGWLDGEVINVAPEHDDCAAVAVRTGRTVKSVWAAAFAAMHEQVTDGEFERTAAS